MVVGIEMVTCKLILEYNKKELRIKELQCQHTRCRSLDKITRQEQPVRQDQRQFQRRS